ncbi:hypothetical protein TKK_0017188 [Trichogramma kaykai]
MSWTNSNRRNNYRNDSRGNYNNNDRRQDRRQDNFSSQESGHQMYVPSQHLGKLIGRAGSKIKEFQEKTNTKILVKKECTQGDSTLIEIIGDKENQTEAVNAISNLLNLGNDVTQSYGDHGFKENALEDTRPSAVDIDWDLASKEADKFQAEKWAKYPPIIKDFYIEDEQIRNMPKQEVKEFRIKTNNINVGLTFDLDDPSANIDDVIPNPVQTFEQAFRHYPEILDEIKKQGFEKPSPIQCQAWPILMKGLDMIGIAQTGTGKTLAFLLPALIHIDRQTIPRKERKGPTCLIIAPTHELALQIEKEVNKYNYRNIKAVCVYGGGDRKAQIRAVAQIREIVIATPGRLNDLVQEGTLDVKGVSYLILDEADRMLDMGFEPQIRKTLLDVRPDRQSVMTSATWPAGVRRLASSYMKNPITVCVGTMDLKAVHSVTQRICIVEEEEKMDMLKDFFHNMGPDDKAIVFFGRKVTVDNIGSDLALSGVKCQSIHGGRDQFDREQALEDIKSGHVNILLATDVASRGIDIEDITHVLNFDFPRDIEEYVHRVGRTGRAGRRGESISFMTRRDWAQAEKLIAILEEAQQDVPEELHSMAERYDAMKKRKAAEGGNSRFGSNRFGGNDRSNNRNNYSNNRSGNNSRW